MPIDLDQYADGPDEPEETPAPRGTASFAGGIDLNQYADEPEETPGGIGEPYDPGEQRKPLAPSIDLNQYEDEPLSADPLYSLDAHSPLEPRSFGEALSGGVQGEAGAGPDWDTIRHRGVALADLALAVGGRGRVMRPLLGSTALHVLDRYMGDESSQDIAEETGRDLAATGAGLGADLITSYALRNKAAVLRLLAPLVSGPIARKVAGGDALDPMGLLGDVTLGPAIAAGRGWMRGKRLATERPASSMPGYPEQLTLEGVQPMPPRQPITHPGDVQPQVRDDPSRDLMEVFREPVAARDLSRIPWTRELAERQYEDPRYQRQVGGQLDEVSDFLRGVKNDPNSRVDLRGVTHILNHYSDPVHHNRETQAAADYMRRAYDLGGDLGRRSGYFDPTAPLRQHYAGPLMMRGQAQAPDVVTAAQQLRNEAGGLRNLQSHARRGTFHPDVNEDDAQILWEQWRANHESGIVASLAFGPKPRDIMPRLHRYVDNHARHEQERMARGLRPYQLTYQRMANRIRHEATVSAENQQQLLAIADDYDALTRQGVNGSTGEIAMDLLVRSQGGQHGGRHYSGFPEAPINSRGVIANDLIARSMQDPEVAMGTGEESARLRALTDTLKQSYDRPVHGAWDRLIGKGLGSLSNTLLARSALLQMGQIPGNIAHTGLENTAEGLARWFHDPSYKPLRVAGGGTGGSIAKHVEEMQPPGAPPGKVATVLRRMLHLPPQGLEIERRLKGMWPVRKLDLPEGTTPTSWLMRGAEYVNRGPGAAGLLPHYEQTLDDLARWHGGGVEGMGPPRSLDIPEELGIRAQEMGVNLTGPYTPTAEGFTRAGRLIDDIQLLSGDRGRNSPMMISSPGRRAAWQFWPFGVGAARLHYRNYLTPAGHGLRALGQRITGRDPNSDLSALRLAADRYARLLPASVAAESAGRLLSDAASAKLFSDTGEEYQEELPGRIGQRIGGTTLGQPFDVAHSAYQGFTAGPWEGKNERSYPSRAFHAGTKVVQDLLPPFADVIEKGDPIKLGASALGMVSPTLGSLTALGVQPFYNLFLKGDNAAADQGPTDKFMDELYNSGQIGDLRDAFRQSGAAAGLDEQNYTDTGSEDYWNAMWKWIRQTDQPRADLHHPLLRGTPGHHPAMDSTQRYLGGSKR